MVQIPNTKAMQYGRKHEDDAFEQCSNEVCSTDMTDDSITLCKSGFWVNPEYPEMGCSPDGLFFQGNTSVELLEIKFPAILEK